MCTDLSVPQPVDYPHKTGHPLDITWIDLPVRGFLAALDVGYRKLDHSGNVAAVVVQRHILVHAVATGFPQPEVLRMGLFHGDHRRDYGAVDPRPDAVRVSTLPVHRIFHPAWAADHCHPVYDLCGRIPPNQEVAAICHRGDQSLLAIVCHDQQFDWQQLPLHAGKAAHSQSAGLSGTTSLLSAFDGSDRDHALPVVVPAIRDTGSATDKVREAKRETGSVVLRIWYCYLE